VQEKSPVKVARRRGLGGPARRETPGIQLWKVPTRSATVTSMHKVHGAAVQLACGKVDQPRAAAFQFYAPAPHFGQDGCLSRRLPDCRAGGPPALAALHGRPELRGPPPRFGPFDSRRASGAYWRQPISRPRRLPRPGDFPRSGWRGSPRSLWPGARKQPGEAGGDVHGGAPYRMSTRTGKAHQVATGLGDVAELNGAGAVDAYCRGIQPIWGRGGALRGPVQTLPTATGGCALEPRGNGIIGFWLVRAGQDGPAGDDGPTIAEGVAPAPPGSCASLLGRGARCSPRPSFAAAGHCGSGMPCGREEAHTPAGRATRGGGSF